MAVINQDGGQHGSAQKVPGGLRDRLMRAVARWPMAQVVGTVCRDEALEQDSEGRVQTVRQRNFQDCLSEAHQGEGALPCPFFLSSYRAHTQHPQ